MKQKTGSPRRRMTSRRTDRRHDNNATYGRVRAELEARELAAREREQTQRAGPAAIAGDVPWEERRP
jgi:hypothetical protein